MVNRVAVFVDAGYLFAQGSILVDGAKRNRGEVLLDYPRAISALEAFATAISGLPLLRVYWYDGTSTGPTAQHIALAHIANVKVRLGFVNSIGQQKGVDSLIVTDMINLARNGGMADAVLLSGDEDLRVGVQQAQEFGVRIHLLGIKPSRGSQSQFLLQEADTCHEWQSSDLSAFLSCKPALATVLDIELPVVPKPEITLEGSLSQVARQTAFEVRSEDLTALLEVMRSGGPVPKDIHAKLLARARAHFKRDLDSAEKKELRRLFLEACEVRTPGSPATGA